MRLLHYYHQRFGLLPFVLIGIFSKLFPTVPDFTGQQVSNEQVIQVVAVFSKRKNHMNAILKAVNDLLQSTGSGAAHEIILAHNAVQLAAQSFG